MKTLTFYSLILLTSFFFGFDVSLAQAANLEVEFAATPLFSNANVVPGDSVTRTVVVRNTGTSEEDVYVSVLNTFSDGLYEVMEINIQSGTDSYFANDFEEFFASTPVNLGALTPGASRTYDFTASLPAAVGNPYQESTLGFDLVIGFEGGDSVTDTPNNGGGGGGGGGTKFNIFNERVSDIDADSGSATVTWNSNRDASSYLVCGNLSDGPFQLTSIPPLFGYQFSLPEIDSDTQSHSMTLTGLSLGSYECRPASRTSPRNDLTVGRAVQFDFLEPTSPTGSVLGVSTTSIPPGPTPEVMGDQVSAFPAGGINLGFGYVSTPILLIIGLALILLAFLTYLYRGKLP